MKIYLCPTEPQDKTYTWVSNLASFNGIVGDSGPESLTILNRIVDDSGPESLATCLEIVDDP